MALTVTATILTLAGGLALLAAVEAAAQARDGRRMVPPGRLVRVNGHRLHLTAMGERRPGQPVVVLEAGMSSWSFHWRRVQPEAAGFARVLAYDRAGLGWSEPGPRPRDTRRLAGELRALLERSGEPGPYLLVGHSMGGIVVRELARQCPQDVAGLVLVDSAADDQAERLPETRQEARTLGLLFTGLAALRRLGLLRPLAPALVRRLPSLTTAEERAAFGAMALWSRYFETSRDECAVVLGAGPARERPGWLGARPLIVVQAGGEPPHLNSPRARERWQRVRGVFDAIQHDLLGLSENSRLMVAERSVHAVPVEQPGVVVRAIREALTMAVEPAERRTP
jgi:pimeloyl-ACP methyl ester carboxylesterase